jgi:hypothetical protein
MLLLAAVAWIKSRATVSFAIWLTATIYSFAAAISFAAINRDATAAERRTRIELRDTMLPDAAGQYRRYGHLFSPEVRWCIKGRSVPQIRKDHADLLRGAERETPRIGGPRVPHRECFTFAPRVDTLGGFDAADPLRQ